jgi:predicted transposase YbfD/YdcC
MEEKAIARITEHIGKVSDPRIENATLHKLIDIIVIAIWAEICGADGWSDVALFGKSKFNWFKRFLELPNGIPSHDTFGRVFELINPDEFRRSFLEWVKAIQKLTNREDMSRVRKDHAPENFAVLRHMAINMLKEEKKPLKAVSRPNVCWLVGMKLICSRCVCLKCDYPATSKNS